MTIATNNNLNTQYYMTIKEVGMTSFHLACDAIKSSINLTSSGI